MAHRFDRSSDLDGGGEHAGARRSAAPGKAALTQRLVRGAPASRPASAPSPGDDGAVAAARGRCEDSMAAALGYVGGPAESVDASARRVQRHGDGHTGLDDAAITAHASHGIRGSGTALPHLDAIQRAFGPAHDLSAVRAHVGGAAAEASAAIGAHAYATGDDVAFAAPPDLFLAAHEATHVVQQRHGVSLKGAVGQDGDAYERHADQVAAAVVRGESVAGLLAEGGGGGGAAVQRFSAGLNYGTGVPPYQSTVHMEVNGTAKATLTGGRSGTVTSDFPATLSPPAAGDASDRGTVDLFWLEEGFSGRVEISGGYWQTSIWGDGTSQAFAGGWLVTRKDGVITTTANGTSAPLDAKDVTASVVPKSGVEGAHPYVALAVELKHTGAAPQFGAQTHPLLFVARLLAAHDAPRAKPTPTPTPTPPATTTPAPQPKPPAPTPAPEPKPPAPTPAPAARSVPRPDTSTLHIPFAVREAVPRDGELAAIDRQIGLIEAQLTPAKRRLIADGAWEVVIEASTSTDGDVKGNVDLATARFDYTRTLVSDRIPVDKAAKRTRVEQGPGAAHRYAKVFVRLGAEAAAIAQARDEEATDAVRDGIGPNEPAPAL